MTKNTPPRVRSQRTSFRLGRHPKGWKDNGGPAPSRHGITSCERCWSFRYQPVTTEPVHLPIEYKLRVSAFRLFRVHQNKQEAARDCSAINPCVVRCLLD